MLQAAQALSQYKGWPSSIPKWLKGKILTERCLFVSEICTMMGSRFLRQVGWQLWF